LSSNEKKQIISLGAGFDTNFFQFKSKGLLTNVIYYEIDFPEVINKKSMIIHKTPHLLSVFGPDWKTELNFEHGEIHSSQYHAICANLRDVVTLEQNILKYGLDFSAPTFFLSECVLIYFPPKYSNEIIKWASKFEEAVFVIYEQIKPNDSFGSTMMYNLEQRGTPLLGIYNCPDLSSQQLRFLSLGWGNSKALNMNEVYSKLDKTRVQRAEKVEVFDELEEWFLIQDHYCISYGLNDKKGTHGFSHFGF